MRKIGMILASLCALAIILSGCGDRETQEPKKTKTEEAAPQAPLLTTSVPLFSSEEIVIPYTGTNPEGSTAATTTTSTAPRFSSAAKKPSSTTTRPSATTSKTTVKPSSSKPSIPSGDGGGLELPDHNWN